MEAKTSDAEGISGRLGSTKNQVLNFAQGAK